MFILLLLILFIIILGFNVIICQKVLQLFGTPFFFFFFFTVYNAALKTWIAMETVVKTPVSHSTPRDGCGNGFK